MSVNDAVIIALPALFAVRIADLESLFCTIIASGLSEDHSTAPRVIAFEKPSVTRARIVTPSEDEPYGTSTLDLPERSVTVIFVALVVWAPAFADTMTSTDAAMEELSRLRHVSSAVPALFMRIVAFGGTAFPEVSTEPAV